jgi:hypothetical protein
MLDPGNDLSYSYQKLRVNAQPLAIYRSQELWLPRSQCFLRLAQYVDKDIMQAEFAPR